MVGDHFAEMRGDGEPKADYLNAGLPYGDQLPLMVRTTQVNPKP